jgi:hypothetical protein
MLIKEKDERINDLKKVNGQLETMVDLLKQKGQNSDSKTSDS